MATTELNYETLDDNKVDMYNYYYYLNPFTGDEIKKIVDYCEGLKLINYEDSYNLSFGRHKVGYIPVNEATSWLYEKLFLLSESANEDMGWNFHLDGIYDDIEYSIFDDNSGDYQWHSDINESPNNKLFLTLFLSIDEEYSGGNLEFNLAQNISSPPNELGDLVISPSYILNRFTPITSGVLRTLQLSISGKPFS